jgi:carboxyl-terminal processing protease
MILKRHVDPPPRQSMLVESVRALYQRAGGTAPLGLGRTVSTLSTEESLHRFLSEAWQGAHQIGSVPDEQLLVASIEGLLRALPERPLLMVPKEARVQEQIRGNRYVGIGVQLGMDREDGEALPVILNPFPRGPARVAGAKPGDRIIEIDGVSTSGVALAAVVDRLRGEQGTSVTLVVQGSQEENTRTLEMTRGVIPFQSFSGYRRLSEDEWVYRPLDSEPIAYLQLSGIRASTLSELRRLAPVLESHGVRGLVLDLRNAGFGASNDLQHTVLLADELLEEGPIGCDTEVSGSTRKFGSGPDCLFRDWPIAVLVDQFTSGESEFLAAALQDNHRAVVVGERTRGAAFMTAPVDLPAGLGQVMLRSGVLSRGDGRPLQRFTEPHAGEIEPEAPAANSRKGPHELSADQAAADWGVRPDRTVAFAPDPRRIWIAWRQQQELPEAPAAGRSPIPLDPQLDKAIEIVKGQLTSR